MYSDVAVEVTELFGLVPAGLAAVVMQVAALIELL
jgi:hypothetical protein